MTVHAGDLDGVDSRLPETTEIALQYLGQCVLSIAVIVFVFPYFIVPLFPIAAMFLYTARYVAHAAASAPSRFVLLNDSKNRIP